MEKITTGQATEIIALFAKKLPLTMLKSVAQKWIDDPSSFESAIATALDVKITVDSAVSKQIENWQNFYKKFFGLDLDFLMDLKKPGIVGRPLNLCDLRIPVRVEGLNCLIIIAKGVFINQVYETGKKNFSSWKWCDGDIESQMKNSERGMVKETYAIWVRDEQEADKDLLGESAEDIKNPQDTESLIERLIHGFKYWSETANHLDVDTYTLCASSRYSDGDVPYVRRSSGGSVGVGRYDPQSRDAGVGARRAVRVG